MNNLYLIEQKERLIEELSKDIKDKKVLEAIRIVPREEFVPIEYRDLAYVNAPLDIGYGQTISQPYIVAIMTELLNIQKDDIVLDIGTGSGYQAAILSLLAKKVVTIERIRQLYNKSKEVLKRLGYKNIKHILGNGIKGYREDSPYDKIICAAAYEEIPKNWINQLKEGGIIVMPLKQNKYQVLISAIKINQKMYINQHQLVKFVPLVNMN